MADSKEETAQFFRSIDWSKMPLTGASEEQLQNLRKIQEQAVAALEQRYEQPNWFKVAAGFLKPQLGGFGASLGSASEALGETVEKQRAQQFPISQMRSEIARTDYLLGQNKKVTDAINKWHAQNPGKLPSAVQIAEWERISPDSPAVKALRDQQKFDIDQKAQALRLLDESHKTGAIDSQLYKELVRTLLSGTQVPFAGLKPPPVDLSATREPPPQGAPTDETSAQGVPMIYARTAEEGKNIYYYLHNQGLPARVNMPDESDRAQEYPSFERLGATPAQQITLTGQQLEALNAKYKTYSDQIIANNPLYTSDIGSNLARLTELLATPGVQKGTGLLYKDQGVVAALKQIIAQGASVSAGTGGMGASFNVSLPVESAISKMNLSPTEQKQLREFSQILSVVARSDLSEATRAIGGGHMNAQEFQSAMGSILSGSDPYENIAKFIAVRLLANERAEKLYDAWGKYQIDPRTAALPAAFFFHEENGPYQRIVKEYDKKIKKARGD